MERDGAAGSDEPASLLEIKRHDHYRQKDCQKYILRAPLINANYGFHSLVSAAVEDLGVTFPVFRFSALRPASARFPF